MFVLVRLETGITSTILDKFVVQVWTLEEKDAASVSA